MPSKFTTRITYNLLQAFFFYYSPSPLVLPANFFFVLFSLLSTRRGNPPVFHAADVVPTLFALSTSLIFRSIPLHGPLLSTAQMEFISSSLTPVPSARLSVPVSQSFFHSISV